MINTDRPFQFYRYVAALILVLLAGHAAAETVRTITIAAPGILLDGHPYYGSGAHERVIAEGWLAGQLRARGVELQWIPVPGDVGSTINEAFTSQRIDFAGYGDLPSIILNASGTRTQLIVPYGRGTDTFLLVPTTSLSFGRITSLPSPMRRYSSTTVLPSNSQRTSIWSARLCAPKICYRRSSWQPHWMSCDCNSFGLRYLSFPSRPA